MEVYFSLSRGDLFPVLRVESGTRSFPPKLPDPAGPSRQPYGDKARDALKLPGKPTRSRVFVAVHSPIPPPSQGRRVHYKKGNVRPI
uniref:Uncharacterized protein n=1 Tax=Sphaerodactylus townsendi TaxID=933632 RepID=A0ACB8FDS7_9SAUR